MVRWHRMLIRPSSYSQSQKQVQHTTLNSRTGHSVARSSGTHPAPLNAIQLSSNRLRSVCASLGRRLHNIHSFFNHNQTKLIFNSRNCTAMTHGGDADVSHRIDLPQCTRVGRSKCCLCRLAAVVCCLEGKNASRNGFERKRRSLNKHSRHCREQKTETRGKKRKEKSRK